MFRSGTQPCTPHEHPSWQPMPRTSQGPLVAPLHRLDEVAAAWPEEQAHHVDTLLNDDKGRSAKFACATEGSDVAVLQSQLRLCEHEIYTLRERLRLAQEDIEHKNSTISSLQHRLNGVPQAELREWCGGPCRGTQPLGLDSQKNTIHGKEARSQRKRRQEHRAAYKPQKDGDLTARESVCSERSQCSESSDLEKQLDREIQSCQGRDEQYQEQTTEDPDVAAWRYSNHIAREPRSRAHRFVVPALPSPVPEEEEGAMALLDREIRSALHLEDAETSSSLLEDERGLSQMNLIQALEEEDGYCSD